MSPDELIQLMREAKSIAQVRKALEKWAKQRPKDYLVLVAFYEDVKKTKI